MSTVLQQATRIGVLGGSFDPIHYGHLAVAEEMRVQQALDAVLFVPTRQAPHKGAGVATAEQRYLMTQLAIAGNPCFFVSRIELDRSGPSYTVETLRELHIQYPTADLYFIIGADMAMDFYNWREPEIIMELAQVVAVNRPGLALEQVRHQLEWPQVSRMLFAEVPALDISSTDLRARTAGGRSLRYLTPEPVAVYIAKEGLYREQGS